MSLRTHPTVDDLLGDSLIQAVMRADGVEPQVVRTLLAAAARRIAPAKDASAPTTASVLFAEAPIDRRAAPRSVGSPRGRPSPLADPCGSALCG